MTSHFIHSMDKTRAQYLHFWGTLQIYLVGNKVICKVTLTFTLYPLFQWYLQSNEILLNLGMKR
jgi:hypothetical protein